MIVTTSPGRMNPSSFRLAWLAAVGGVDRRAEERVVSGFLKALLRDAAWRSLKGRTRCC